MVSLKSSLAFLSFYVLYLFTGSILFKALECPHEVALRRELAKEEEESMILVTLALKKVEEELAPSPETTFVKHQLSKQLSKRKALKKEIVCETWSMYNSMFFVFTSITTIGYGTVTPQTQLGRGSCLIYCIIGIPTNSYLICLIGTLFMKQVSNMAKISLE